MTSIWEMSDQTNMETIANNCSWVQSWIILCVLSPSWDIGGLSVGGGGYCLVKGPLGCPSTNSWWPFKFFRPSRQTSRVRHCVDRIKMEKKWVWTVIRKTLFRLHKSIKETFWPSVCSGLSSSHCHLHRPPLAYLLCVPFKEIFSGGSWM